MTDSTPAIRIVDLVRNYGRTEGVAGLSLEVQAGRCYGFFGRNGAGKTTTIKCLLNHLVPQSGRIEVFGIEPQKDEVGIKKRIGYVPESVAFYPWMTVRDTLNYAASFRERWNNTIEEDLLNRFDLDQRKRVKALSKGMNAQLALICAVCPEPGLLVLDEPTSGLDPIVRRDFIETVIGSYLEGDPDHRTVFVSTHLISEFEGLIDEFTIIDRGKNRLTMRTDEARERFKRIRMRFEDTPPKIPKRPLTAIGENGNGVEVLTGDYTEDWAAELRNLAPESFEIENLTLEETFIASERLGRSSP
jgi:ABC-2 type transport system ATP-binding protein